MRFNFLSRHGPAIILLVLAGAIAFSGSLTNEFVGDDEVIIVHNDFYKSLKNFSHLFDQTYLSRSEEYFFERKGSYFNSGAVSYRPVASASHFFDYAIWKLNPFGYHLDGLLLHLINSALVYFLLYFLLKSRSVSTFGALLFCVHPVHAETLCVVTYRPDLFAGFFVLVSFLCFVLSDRHKGVQGRWLYGGSILAYFLAVFSKESAIVLPGFILAYDFCFEDKGLKGILRRLKSRYGGFLFVTVFYLYIYLVVFPNSAVELNRLMGGGIMPHIMAMLYIGWTYVVHLLFPFCVNILPPLYAPPMDSWGARLAAGLFALLIAGVVVWMSKRHRRDKEVSFFVVWFFVSIIPVSNLVPLANPIAHRFLYIPSIGFLALVAVLIERLSQRFHATRYGVFGKALKFGLIVTCILTTIAMNGIWKDNFVISTALTNRYPRHPKGFAILGIEYFKIGLWGRARANLSRARELGDRDPRIPRLIDVCSAKLSETFQEERTP